MPDAQAVHVGLDPGRWPQAGDLGPEDRQVRGGIAANYRGRHCLTIGQPYMDRVVLFDHMMGRDNNTVGRPDNARSRKAATGFHPHHTRTGDLDGGCQSL
jgi:hypothetical protein